jgi:hypothetical protein
LYFCYKLKQDSDDAKILQVDLFTPKLSVDESPQFDGTKANAFLHSFWTGAMTLTADHDSINHSNETLGYKFAVAHEGHAYANADKRADRRRSQMDMHNNRLAYDTMKDRLTFQYLGACNTMIDKLPLGLKSSNPRLVPRDDLAWLYSRTKYGQGKMVHRSRRSCNLVYGNDGSGLHHQP